MSTVAEALKKKGNESLKNGLYKQAVEDYTESLRHDSENALVYSNRSLVLTKLSEFSQALSDAERCIERRPQWAKGHLRKAAALEGLKRFDEVMMVSAKGFKLASENKLKEDLVALWFASNQMLNRLPEGCIELPSGIFILSKEYLNVLAHLMRSLSGEMPLTHQSTLQCLSCCADQVGKVLRDFGESTNPIIHKWCQDLPLEVYPYATSVKGKAAMAEILRKSTKCFVDFIAKEVDPALYVILRPILGLVVLIVLNRSNILCETNTGHHSSELMNTAIIQLFETSILHTNTYYSMYIGRICAVLDSFIGRGYTLEMREIETVKEISKKLEKVMEKYPKHVIEFEKDQTLARRTLSNVRNNVLLPSQLTPPTVPVEGPMTVEIAQQLAKKTPEKVKAFLTNHLAAINSTPFLSIRDVEDLLTASGIYIELGDREAALCVFTQGEQAFFKVMGHLLSTNTIRLDQCSATIIPIRQLVFTQASLLNLPSLFADITVRWKCLFTEVRSILIKSGLGPMFGDLFEWYKNEKSTSAEISDESLQKVLDDHRKKEEILLQRFSVSTFEYLRQQSHQSIQEAINPDEVVLDYIFFATSQSNPQLDAYVVAFTSSNSPTICKLDYGKIRRVAGVIKHLIANIVVRGSDGSSTINESVCNRISPDLHQLAQVLLPGELSTLTSGRLGHIYLGSDADIAVLPLDMMPFEKYLPVQRDVSVAILSSGRELLRIRYGLHESSVNSTTPSDITTGKCCLVANPDYNLEKPAEQVPLIANMISTFASYFSLSTDTPAQKSIDSLPYSEEEAKLIATTLRSAGFSVQTFLQDDAKLSKIWSISRPMLLHLSSHAFASVSRSTFRNNFWSDLDSSVALAGYNTYLSGKFSQLDRDCGNGQIPAMAVCAMDLQNTRLVFLSTCSSAVGDSLAQETVGNLVEAFQNAGAETVIATLWPVADIAASKFCSHFYEKLVLKGVRPSQALMHAKKQLQSQNNPLFYWGSFTCYGLDRPVS